MRWLVIVFVAFLCVAVGAVVWKWWPRPAPVTPAPTPGAAVVLVDSVNDDVWLSWAEPPLNHPSIPLGTRAIYLGEEEKSGRRMARVVIDEGDIKGVVGFVETNNVVIPR
jgi:hypothetical protein